MADNEVETAPVKEEKAKKTKSGSKNVVPILVVLMLILAVGAVAYWWRDQKAKDQQKQLQTQVDQLKEQLESTQKELTNAKATDTTTDITPAVPTQALVDNIKAVFASGNSAALEGYMANPVVVLYAASDGIGPQTPSQATKDITDFMATATDPWNFNLPAATLAAWRSGSYKQYFPSNAVIGKSDKMVIAFSFNGANKISTVFMSNSVDVLTQ